MSYSIATNAEAWQLLPAAASGQGAELPVWARQLVKELPRTTATLLQLEYAQRTRSPVQPGLRAAMRYVAARINGSKYAAECALLDARQAGVSAQQIAGLDQEGFPGWSVPEQRTLEFARGMTVDSDAVTDDHFAELVRHFSEQQAASMVLLMAYSNFQDRLLNCLGPAANSDKAAAAQPITFSPQSFVIKTTAPPARPKNIEPLVHGKFEDVVKDEPEWAAVTYTSLQDRLENQRRLPTRLRVPEWDAVARNLPEGLINRPSDIVWYRIVFGYAPELAVPFEYFMRTAGAEAAPKWDRIFGSSLFWVVTRAVKCPYCMGHCEMNWEVAGLKLDEIADRSQQLAGEDWSSFPPAEQHAFAFARKLTRTPGNITESDIAQLQTDFGPDRALVVMLNASRYHYMTRISNGFQLTLERENVFYDYYNVPATADAATNVPLLSDEDCWKRLPRAVSGANQPLPNWVRAVAEHLPRTAAAMLELDAAHRLRSPLDPVLRAKLRWVVAQANRCAYTQAYAIADLKRSGQTLAQVNELTGPPELWPQADREPLEFARLLTVSAPQIPDELFEKLRARYGEKQVAAMVLLAAYGNFQDRLILGLNLPLEAGGPMAPIIVKFGEDAFQMAPFVPPSNPLPQPVVGGKTLVAEDPVWADISYPELQTRLDRQRDRQPRLPVPTWEQVQPKIPAAMASRPTRIVWNLVCSGYVPELAVPWSIATRTMWAEAGGDRVFEESLFWIQTRAIQCNYCMGHCEMLLEVAGLNPAQVQERTKLLAGNDWSSFPPAEQRAYAYARKLSLQPWELTGEDYSALQQDFGPKTALATFWWLCRGLYMTRVSDGFQLPLERENVFAPPAPAKPAQPVAVARTPTTAAPGVTGTETTSAAPEKVSSTDIERLSQLKPEEVEQKYEGKPQPEAIRMLLSIQRDQMMGAGDGWFGPAAARYSWKWLAERHSIKPEESISADKFLGSPAIYARLDRNRNGQLNAEDFDWSDRNPWVQQSYLVNRIFRKIDPTGAGQVSREEWQEFFNKASQGKDRLIFEDLRDAVLAGVSSSFTPGDRPSKEMLIKGLIGSEVGSLQEGPGLNEPAPDFELKLYDGSGSIRLSKVIGPKPVVLVFGNYTCGPFRSMFPAVDDLHERYKDQVTFLAVYVREAHPTDGWVMESNTKLGVKTAQPTTYLERVQVAQQCHRLIQPAMPLLVDDIKDTVGNAYSGMPARLYVIDKEGKVAYKAGRGPFGFKSGEMEQSLLMLLLDEAAKK